MDYHIFGQSNSFMKAINRNLNLFIYIIIIAFAYMWNLDTPVMWGDEAGTAAFSRNVIKTGFPEGFDGRNLLVYENCASVSKSLLSNKIPWVQYYTGALSLLLFGESTRGIRLLFVIIGMCAFFPLYAILKKQSQYAALITTVVLISPQVVFFQRNARYFPIIIFLFSFLLWIYHHESISFRLRIILSSVSSIIFFHTHHLSAFCSMISLVLFCLIRDRKATKIYLTAFLLGLVSWLIFYLSLEGMAGGEYTITHLFFENTLRWVLIFFDGIKASILDFDFINSFPLIAWGMIFLVSLLKRYRKITLKVLGYSVNQIILINIAFQIAANSALVGYETKYQYAVLRYMPHLITAGLIILFLVIERLVTQIQNKRNIKSWVIPLAFFLVIISNVFTFSFWFKPLPHRTYRVSWWLPVYSEIIKPEPDSIKKVMDTIISENSGSNEDTIWVWPAYMNEIFIFYAGYRYLIRPDVTGNSECEKSIIKKVGTRAYGRFFKNPKWIIIFLRPLRQTPSGYEMLKVPYYRHSADASRPELTRHGFIESVEKRTGYITIYKKL